MIYSRKPMFHWPFDLHYEVPTHNSGLILSQMSVKYFFVASFLLLVCSNAMNAQSDMSDNEQVEKVIHTMFEGMRLGDSAMVRQVFYSEAQFFSAFVTPKGSSKLKEGSVQEWLDAIGTPHDQVWNEEWWNPSINVDGNFAHVWTPYAFYVDDTFSHCGVDSFHMIKDDSGTWKIFHATDTRRRSGCDTFIPGHIKAKHSSRD